MSCTQPQDLSEDARNKNQEDLDEVVLLRLFPEEIWKPILKTLKDLKGLENLSNSSPFFHERLLSRRVMFIFPAVFEVLMERNEEDDELFCQHDNHCEQCVQKNSNGVDDVDENNEENGAVEENGVEQNFEVEHEDENVVEENDNDDDEEENDSDDDEEENEMDDE